MNMLYRAVAIFLYIYLYLFIFIYIYIYTYIQIYTYSYTYIYLFKQRKHCEVRPRLRSGLVQWGPAMEIKGIHHGTLAAA